MNIHVQIFAGTHISFPFDGYLGVGLLGHMTSRCLTFQETAQVFSEAAVPPQLDFNSFRVQTATVLLSQSLCSLHTVPET